MGIMIKQKTVFGLLYNCDIHSFMAGHFERAYSSIKENYLKVMGVFIRVKLSHKEGNT